MAESFMNIQYNQFTSNYQVNLQRNLKKPQNFKINFFVDFDEYFYYVINEI